MVLLLSKTNAEITTEMVMDWLSYYQTAHLRLNGEDLLEDVHFDCAIDGQKDAFALKINGIDINHTVNVIWFRRMADEGFFQRASVALEEASGFRMTQHLRTEFLTYYYLLEKFFDKVPWLSKPSQFVNKIYALLLARQVGLAIPDTLVTNNKAALQFFLLSHNQVITKALRDAVGFTVDNHLYQAFTSELGQSRVDSCRPTFFPSLCQKNIRKKFELRVFFLEREYYAMAIFSQSSAATQTDFRDYDHARPNRCVPYKLPGAVVRKLRALMKLLDLQTGSIDLIVDENGEYVFLEVNPVGQLGMVSIPCNYQLEKKIAQYLIKHDQENERNVA